MENILIQIQSELKAPKNQFNAFGKYYYRNCEDILEALKPLLLKYKSELIVSDEIVNIGNRYYVKAISRLITPEKEYISMAFAREEEDKKGMDGAQVTGAASSYARKYALNGLFLIDDTKDADHSNNHEEKPKTTSKVESVPIPQKEQSKTDIKSDKIDTKAIYLSGVYNEKSARSEYRAMVDNNELVVFVKKPLQEFDVRADVILKGFRSWDWKDKIYNGADDIEVDVKIPF